ncbi:UDP-glucuronic acid decarboxylase 2 [Asimina triloba]
MGSELIYRGHEPQRSDEAYSPKLPKPWFSTVSPSIHYMLREQRLLFVFIGMVIATLVFSLSPARHRTVPRLAFSDPIQARKPHHSAFESSVEAFRSSMAVNSGAKVPLGLKKKGLRIVVTGGAGFVGSHLVDRLIARGDSVIVVDNFFTGRKENVMHHFNNPRFELIRHDVVEPLLLEVDQIYHLACPASPVHYKFNPHKTNVVGTLNMLGLAKRVGARFLLTSTSEVYGDPLQHPQVETYWGNVNPIGEYFCALCTGVRSCYDEGKRTAETLTMDYHRGANVEVRMARIFNTYGPRMCIDDGRVVSNFVAQALRKEPLTVYGDGKQTRSFQYVSDLVEGLIRLMEGEHIGPFNLGNPGEFTMLELAKSSSPCCEPDLNRLRSLPELFYNLGWAGKAAGVFAFQVVQETIDPNARIEFRPNTEDDPHKRKPDISKAKEQLGWEPVVPLRKGLPLMVSDFRTRIFGDHAQGA